MEEMPASDMGEAQSAGEGRLRTLCRWLTSWPAVLLYAFCIAYADKRVFFCTLRHFTPLAVFLSFLFWYAALRVSMRSFLFSILVTLPLLLDLVAELYVVLTYHVEYRTVVETAFHTNIRQASPFLDVPAVSCLVAGTLAALALPVVGRLAGRRGVWRPLLVLGFTLAAIVGFVKSPAKYHISLYKRYNWNWCTWVGEAAEKDGLQWNPIHRHFVDVERPENIFLPCSRVLTWYGNALDYYFPEPYPLCTDAASECTLPEGHKVNVALYIVESFRRDHSPFCGYARNTMPMLSERKGNLIVLPALRSFGTHSVQSLYGMLSDADENDRHARHTAFPALFHKHGFNCVLIENNAFGASWSDRPGFRQLLKGGFSAERIVHDDNDFPPLVAEHLAGNARNMLLIYDGTSHYPFETPGGSRYGKTLIDDYDETRHIIDAALCRFLDSMADSPSIVLITSDHGESFGEGGRLCHGGPLSADEQREVFAAIWYSDSYAEQFPEVVQALKDNAAAFTSQDFFFHTIPSMGGIHSSLRKQEWDMTEKHPAATSPRPVAEEPAE